MRQNGKFQKNKKRIIPALFITAVSFGVFGACAPEGEDFVGGYVLPEGKTVEVGTKYTPDFSLESSVTAMVVDLFVPQTSRAELDGGCFTPDVTGVYEIVVRFKKTIDGVTNEVEERVRITAIDTTEPEIFEIQDKTVETGLYEDLGKDLASIIVTDNCAQTVTVYAESYTFNGVTTPLGIGVNEVRLSKEGDYEIKVVAEDYSGNKSTASYTLKAEDTTAPAIDVKSVAVAWSKDGKVAIPVADITDLDDFTLTTTVTDSSGNTVDIQDDAFTASEGIYTLTYTAVDVSGNSSSKATTLIVKEKGMIADFSTQWEQDAWDGETIRVENDDEKLKIYNLSKNETAIEYVDGFTLGDWTDYNVFEADVENGRNVPLTVSAQFLVNGVWQATAKKEINSADTFRVYLSDYQIEKVEGLRLSFACSNGIIAMLDNIRVGVEADNREYPDWNAYELSAKEATQIPVGVQDAQGVVKYTVYANVACTIKTGLQYENGTVSSIISLKEGANEIVRYPNAESGEDLVSSTLQSLILTNTSDYGVKVYVSDITYASVSEIALESYAHTTGEFGVAYGETFAVPSPFKVSSGWYSDLSVSIYQEETLIKEELVIGSAIETLGENALPAGVYQIVYTFTDIAGVAREIRYDLIIEPNYIYIEIESTALFANTEGVTLPKYTITGTEENIANAELTVYYRAEGKKAWKKVTETQPFIPKANEWCEIRFVVASNGHYREVTTRKFIHMNNFTLDFEPEEAVKNECNYREWLKGDKLVETDEDGNIISETIAEADKWSTMRSRFLFDGGYYDYRPNRTDNRFLVYSGWSKSGGYSLSAFSDRFNGMAVGLYIRPMMVTEAKGVNAISFWAKADGKITPNFELGTGGAIYGQKWYATEPTTLEQGVGYYTVYLKEAIPAGEAISLFYMGKLSQGNRICFDDITFHYVNRVSPVDENEYADQANNEGYELKAPLMTSDLLSAEDLKKANILLKYSYENGEYVELAPNEDGKYNLKLEQGGFVKFKWEISYENVWTSDITDKFTWVIESKEVLIGKARMHVEHAEIVFKGDTLALGAPTCADGDMSEIAFAYKFAGTSDWTEVAPTNGEYVVPTDTVGWIDIRYTSKVKINDTLTVDGIYVSSIYVRDPSVFIDFEGSDPFNGGVTYFDSPYSKGKFPASELVAIDETNNHAQKLLMKENAWEGIYWAEAKELDKAYTTLRLRIYAEKEVEGYRIELWQGSGGWSEVTVDLNAGWNDVVLTFPEFTKLGALIFKITKDGSLPTIMIDDIKLITVNYSDEMPTKAKHKAVINLPTATMEDVNGVISYRVKGTEEWTTIENGTSFIPQELAIYEVRYAFENYLEEIFEIEVGYNTDVLGAEHAEVVMQGEAVTLAMPTSLIGTLTNIKVEYKAYGTEEWTELTVGTGGYAFPTDTVGWYRLRYTATVTTADNTINAEYQSDIYVRDPSVFIDFEGSDPFNGGVAYFDSPYSKGQFPASEFVAIDETNNHAQKLLMKENGWEGIYWAEAKELDKAYTQMSVRIYAETAVEDYRIELWQGSGKWPEVTVDLNAGWNDVVLTFPEFTKLRALIFKIAKNGSIPTIMIDEIRLISMEFDGEVPTNAVVDQEVTLPTATCTGVSATLAYRVKGTEEWFETDGAFTPTEVAVYEIRYAFEGYFDYVVEMKVTYNVTYASDIPTTAKVGDVVTIPTATAGSEVGKTFYRVYGEETWIEGGSFTAEQSGTYEICYRFDCIEEDIVYNVIIRDDSVFMDFEGDDPFLGGKSYFNLANPNHALKGGTVVELEDGSHAMQFPALWDTGGWWDGIGWATGASTKDLGGSFTKLSMRIYAPKAVSNVYFYFLFDSGVYEKKINLVAGWQTVEFDLGKTVTKISYLSFNTKPEHDGMLWDDVKFYNA